MKFTEQIKRFYKEKHGTAITIGSACVLAAVIAGVVVINRVKPAAAVSAKDASSVSSKKSVTVPDIDTTGHTSSTESDSSGLILDVTGESDPGDKSTVPTGSGAAAEPAVVSVTGITLSTYDVTIAVGQSTMPIVTMMPSNATDKSEIWESNNTAVATVNSYGKIVGKSAGTCVVTVKSAQNGNITASVNVNVSEAQTPVPAIEPSESTPSPVIPTTPHNDNDNTSGATGEICPHCGKPLWDCGRNDIPDGYCYGLEGIQLG